jgi:2-desacetyl-2-hydroxyethyl bacteriochlorophyllide A dehydrogenase
VDLDAHTIRKRESVKSSAVRYRGEEHPVFAEVEASPPQAHEVQIAVDYVGICGTDLHILDGAMDHRTGGDRVLGHEMSGRIAAIGSQVTGWYVGDRVTVMPLDWCGTCPACVRGHRHLCHALRFLGIDAHGAMQSYWNVDSRILVGLPAQLDARHAALVEPTAVAFHDVGRAELRPGDQVCVVGAGPVGVLVALVARRAGAHVTILEPNAFRRWVAEGLEFRAFDPGNAEALATVKSWNEGAGFDVAFEVSGSAAGVDLAVDALAVRGRLILVGIHTSTRDIDLFRVFWRELSISGARLYDRADFLAAIDFLVEPGFPADALISRVVDLDHPAEAFDALRNGSEVMKVLIDCRATGRLPTGGAG